MKAQLDAGTPLSALAIPAPVRRPKRDYPEFRIQSAFVKLWRANCARLGIAQCLGFAIPNGSVMGGGSADWQVKERQIRGRLQKLAGVESGVCDWFLSVPSPRETIPHTVWWHGLYIEFKAPNGTLADDQEAFAGSATARGYRCEVHTSATEAWKSLLNYLNK